MVGERVIVYAIFLCMQASCQMMNTQFGRLDTLGPLRGTPFYRTAAACEKAIRAYIPTPADAQGHHIVGPGMWYECRHRHIDTWESQ